MRLRKLRHRLAMASSLAAAGTAAALLLGSATAQAAVTIPSFPTFGTYPSWLSSTGQVGNTDTSEGSDTTLFMMQSISNTYNSSGILPFGCQLASDLQHCNLSGNPNVSQSDPLDNFTGTQEVQGTWNVGSGNGQDAICGKIAVPLNTTVDYSRSSKPYSDTCSAQQMGYAKDAIAAVDFPNIDPQAYGTASGYIGKTFISYNSAGTQVNTAFPSGGIGSVAAGWEPGDPFNCVANDSGASSNLCSGTPFEEVDNTPISGGNSLTSAATRLWCTHGSKSSPDQSQIMDWGQLTNLSPGQVAGQGTPIGVPIRITAVNQGSGTLNGFMNFADGGNGATSCAAKATYDSNGAQGQNPQSPQGLSGNLEIALENNAAQVGDFANANWGSSDAADQAVDIATSLYFISYGVYKTNSVAAVTSIETNPGVVPASLPTSFTSSLLAANGDFPNTGDNRANLYAMSRTLFNIIPTTTVKSSTAGFLNWMCDGGGASGTGAGAVSPMQAKGPDRFTGVNYDTDLNNIIQGQYGFSRLSDTSAELPLNQLAVNGVANPNGTCAAVASITGSTTSTITVSSLPAAAALGWTVEIPNGYNLKLGVPGSTTNGFVGDTIDTITAISGNTITLAHSTAAGIGSTAPPTLYFPGHPPVTKVTDGIN
jgi:hypothetical protein